MHRCASIATVPIATVPLADNRRRLGLLVGDGQPLVCKRGLLLRLLLLLLLLMRLRRLLLLLLIIIAVGVGGNRLFCDSHKRFG